MLNHAVGGAVKSETYRLGPAQSYASGLVRFYQSVIIFSCIWHLVCRMLFYKDRRVK